MLHSHLKQGLRLNRTMGLSFLVYAGLLGCLTVIAPGTPDLIPMLRLAGLGLLTLIFLLVNEVTLKTIKRHARLDDVTLEKLSLLAPLASGFIVALAYLISGQLGILLFSLVMMLQAQIYGHQELSRKSMVFFALLYAVTLPLGYPILLGLPGLEAPAIPFSIQIVLAVLPFIWTLMHLGSVVGSLVRSTTTKVTKLQSLAATDALTGLVNRRQFNQQLDAEIARARRYRKPLSLVLFDIDDFKKVNDFYGHPTGDRILRELGQLIINNVRESDVAARYGGEEFALILPETSQIDAYDILERLRALVERTVFCLPDNPMTVTISVGVAQLDPDQAKSYELVERADAALYEAKKQGKNRVIYGVVPTPKLTYPPFTSR